MIKTICRIKSENNFFFLIFPFLEFQSFLKKQHIATFENYIKNLKLP